MNIKKKLASAVEHVKSHPVLFTYLATTAVIGTAVIVAERHYFKTHRIVDLDKALAQINDNGLNGLYYPLKNETLLMVIAPDDFQP